MTATRCAMRLAIVACTVGLSLTPARAQPGPPYGKDHQADMATFHFLIDNRKDITRQVTKLADGVETATESDKADVAARIQEHVAAMHRRLKDGNPIHLRDPLFAEVFRHANKIDMRIKKTRKGVRVKETSKDAYVVKLIQAHAEVVSKFIENGRAEMRQNHAVPPRDGPRP